MKTNSHNEKTIENSNFQNKKEYVSSPNSSRTAPLISVIVPVYNVEKYLKQCLDSVVGQSLKNIEIILINDGSTDRCGAICDDYALKDERIKVIHKKNSGLGAAYNTGLDLACGEYIGFVESDDWIDSRMYERLYSKAKEFDAEVCIGGFYYFKDGKDMVYTGLLNITPCNCVFFIQDYPQFLTLQTTVWSKIYKRETLGQIRFSEFKNSGYYCDIPYWIEVACLAKTMVRIDECIYHYRIDNVNSSTHDSRSDSKLLTILLALEKSKELLKKYNYYDTFKEELYFNSASTLVRFFGNIDQRYRREFFSGTKKFFKDLKDDKNFRYKYFKKCDYRGSLAREFLRAALSDNYNEALKISILLKGAKSAVENSLNYRLGKTILDNYKSPKGLVRLPSLLLKQHKISKANGNNFINIAMEKCPDYQLGLAFKNHLSYKLGEVLTETKTLFKIISLPFRVYKAIKEFRQQKMVNFNEMIIKKLNNMEVMISEIKSDLLASVMHPNIFEKYKNVLNGKDVVILGTGPTLNFYKTPIQNAIHIGTNRSFVFDKVELDYLFLQHTLYPEGNAEVEEYVRKNPNVKCFLGCLPSTFLYNRTHYRHPPRSYYYGNTLPYIIKKSQEIWALDLAYEPVGDFESVVFAALQFACYTNPKRIYLVGCDCSQGHFYGDDFYADHDISRLIPKWKKIKPLLDKFYPHIGIISVNPIGLENLFEDYFTDDFIIKEKDQ